MAMEQAGSNNSPFEKAAKHFEKKTQTVHPETEENLEQFRASTIKYLKNKQRSVQSFISKLKYKGHKEDYRKYIAAIKGATKPLEDGATKNEMVLFKAQLYLHSETLKAKLVMKNKERVATNGFDKMNAEFQKLGISMKVSVFVQDYLGLEGKKLSHTRASA